ncbi:hypothetical protein NEMIN01_2395 [Nematocida minor]|uniref:uncharacterized protein n=1 Tax=Nematocida minor TaxID=1912983 RepID=UPI00222003F8|nr:uncharacterized protein NEMIN01_2395 [Nematocida minor]KAI5193066.1 hypothetical protein NEMIN01_2395 [Nematocida minor]
MARQGNRASSALRNGVSSLSTGFSIKNETSNMKRSLCLKPTSHSGRSNVTWLSSMYIFASIVLFSIFVNTLSQILYSVVKLGLFSMSIMGPPLLFIGASIPIVLGTAFLYHKVFDVKMVITSYLLILSYTVGLPLLLMDRTLFLILPIRLMEIHKTIFSFAPMIVLGLISQYIIRINLKPITEPATNERSEFIRQFTIILGQTLSSLLFYYMLLAPSSTENYLKPGTDKFF